LQRNIKCLKCLPFLTIHSKLSFKIIQ